MIRFALCDRVLNVVFLLAALPGHCADVCCRCHWMLCLLPGSKELTNHGLLQKSDTPGTLIWLESVSLVSACNTGQMLSVSVGDLVSLSPVIANVTAYVTASKVSPGVIICLAISPVV